MKSNFLLMAVITLLTVKTFAQFKIEGTVIDAEVNKPLPGANVIIQNSFKGTHTSSNGAFRLTGLESGHYNLKVSYLGYEEVIEELYINSDTNIEVKLFPKTFLSEEVVVSATRSSSRGPLTHTNMSREEIMPTYLSQDMPYLINHTPSVVVSSDAGAGVGYSNIRIRGTDQSRINVTINGIPVNDSESHGVWWVNMPDIVSSAENIQIQRGVGTSTQGAAAFGATLNIKTSTLREKAYAEASSIFGSFNTMRNTLSFGTGLLNNNWNIDGRVSRITSDGYVDRGWSNLNSYYFSGGYYGEKLVVKAVTFSGREQTYLAWNGVPSDSLDNNRTFNPSGLYYDKDGKIQYYDNETDNYQQDHYQLHFLSNIADGVNANLSLHYTKGKGYYEQYREYERLNRYGLDPVALGDTLISRTDLIRRRWLDNDFYGFTWSVNYDSYSKLKIDAGGGYNIYEGDHFGEIIWGRHLNTDIRHNYYENDARKTDFNVFGKAAYEIIEGLNIFADLQLRMISYSFLGLAWVHEEITPLQQSVTYTFFNPKAGFNYSISNSHAIYGYYGVSHREPVRRDFTESSPDSRPRPEKMQNIELGYRLQESQFFAGINLYLMNYVDQMIPTGEINDVGGFTRTNIPESYRQGIELEAGYIFGQYLQWNANFTLSRNIIMEYTEYYDKYDESYSWIGTESVTYHNTDIAFSPSVIAASNVITSPFKGFDITLSTKFVGQQYLDNTSSLDRMLDPYLINDLRFNYSFSTKHVKGIELVIMINNLFDVHYIPNGWVYNGLVEGMGVTTIDDGMFPQAGRHFAGGLNLKF